MLAGLRAIQRVPEFKSKEKCEVVLLTPKKKKRMSQAETLANCEKQLSTVVIMAVEGHTADEIVAVTNVSKSFINRCKVNFGLIRPKPKCNRDAVSNYIKSAPPYTYGAVDIAKHVGVTPTVIYKLIADMPFIKRGERDGIKNKFCYDHFEEMQRAPKIGSRGVALHS